MAWTSGENATGGIAKTGFVGRNGWCKEQREDLKEMNAELKEKSECFGRAELAELLGSEETKGKQLRKPKFTKTYRAS